MTKRRSCIDFDTEVQPKKINFYESKKQEVVLIKADGLYMNEGHRLKPTNKNIVMDEYLWYVQNTACVLINASKQKRL